MIHTIHENVDEQNLHGIKRVAHSEHSTEGDEGQSSTSRAELEGQEILNIMEDGFAWGNEGLSARRGSARGTEHTNLLPRQVK